MNLLVVFLLSGLWHGADWKFVIWGAIHGCLLITSRIGNVDKDYSKKLPGWLQTALTFAVVTVAWMFFRAHNVGDAFMIVCKLAKLSSWDLPNLPISDGEMGFCMLLIVLLFLKEHLLPDYVPARRSFWPSLGVATLLCYLWGVFGSNQFIYFQF